MRATADRTRHILVSLRCVFVAADRLRKKTVALEELECRQFRGWQLVDVLDAHKARDIIAPVAECMIFGVVVHGGFA